MWQSLVEYRSVTFEDGIRKKRKERIRATLTRMCGRIAKTTLVCVYHRRRHIVKFISN